MANNTGSILNSVLLAYVPEEERETVLSSLKMQTRLLRRGEAVFHTGDVIDRIGIVVSGSVRSEKNYADGDVHILSVFEKHAVLALDMAMSKTRVSPVDYIANESGEIVLISMESLRSSDHWGNIQRILVETLADELIRSANKNEMLAQHSIRGRVLTYLRTVANKAGTDEITISMNREQLAQFLCVNRTSLSNELSLMQQEGLIEFRKNRFRLLHS